MALNFSKYEGTGNDFILVDNRTSTSIMKSDAVKRICHRRYGVGGDGVIFLCFSRTSDYGMRIFNADGSEAEMCGNGMRCLVDFIRFLGDCSKKWTIEANKHRYLCTIDESGEVSIDMGVPIISTVKGSEYWVDAGVPHYIMFTRNLERFDKEASEKFQHLGINISYVRLDSNNQISMRTFERGVGETFSCGTGASAASAAAWHFAGCCGRISVRFIKDCVMLYVTVYLENAQLSRVLLSGKVSRVYGGIW